MARGKPTKRRKYTRAELLILVVQLLEAAGADGISTAELLAALAYAGLSTRTLYRILSDLRAKYDADVTSTGQPRRWRLESRGQLSLEAPGREDIAALTHALAAAKRVLAPKLYDHLATIVEILDERARGHVPATDLPPANAVTSSSTRSVTSDDRVVAALLLACRRQTVRIQYRSPRRKSREPVCHDIEPWALELRDGAYYLCAWSLAQGDARTFNVARICSVDVLATAPPRQPVPAKPFAAQGAAFGIDSDRPGIAVVGFRGDLADRLSTVSWHPSQRDEWNEDEQLLVRTIPYNSRREIIRLLASFIDGMVSLEPPELAAELAAHLAHGQRLFG